MKTWVAACPLGVPSRSMPSTEPVGEAVPARAAAGQDGGEATWDVTGYGAVLHYSKWR